MKLTHVCLNRPVTTLMFFVALILLGFISLSFLPQELFPPLSYPQITIFTIYKEASPQEIETLITRPVEESVGTVNGLKKVSSISKEGASIVMAEFDWKTNMDFASLEVREKLDIIKERFPKEAEEPLVMKYNPFETPTMRINVTGEEDPLILKRIAEKDIKESLEKTEGVGSIEIVGGTNREIRIEVNESKLRSVSLSILDIVHALERSNLNYPAGTIKEPFFEFNIRTVGEFKTVKEIEKLPIKAELPYSDETPFLKQIQEEKAKEENITLPGSERLVALGDIAEIKDTSQLRNSISRFQGKESVSLLIRKQSGVNTVRVTQRIRDELQSIQQKLPSAIKLKIVHDESLFIKEALSEVKNAAALGALFAFFVILFFLRNWVYSLIVIVSIPLSIIIVFLFMHLFHLSLNLISLGGLALGAGMLVDNCIVVLESIFINTNENLKEKVGQGTVEVSTAIFSSTLTTICVFLPMIFITGIAGQIFKHLSFSIVFSLVASLLVSLTILPLLVYFALRYRNVTTSDEVKIESWDKTFNFLFARRNRITFLVFILFLLSSVSFMFLKKELFPKIDQHAFTLNMEAPPGTPLSKTDRFVREVEEILFRMPEVEEVTVNIGSSSGDAEQSIVQSQGAHQAQVFVSLDKRTSTSLAVKALEKRLDFLKNEEIMLNFIAEQGLLKEAFIQQSPVALEIKGYSMQVLQNIGNVLEQRLKDLPILYNVKTDYPPSRPEIKINVKKDVAMLSHISTDRIARTLNTSIKGRVATTFKETGEEYPIRVILREEDRENLNKMKRLIIHGVYRDKGVNVPLTQVADIIQGSGPLEIKRIEGQRTLIVTADLYKSSLGEALTRIESLIEEIPLPEGYRIVISGEGKKMGESFFSLIFALILAILMVFMVMASSFESLWQPFIILFTIPLSIIGVVIFMFATNTSLNAISFLGLIMLGGIIVNNGIVLVDYINLLIREEKIPLEDALRLGSERRIRPILMTSLTTIMGLIPLSLQASLMSPLGRVTMGGLASATFLTPVIIPFLYYYFYQVFGFIRNVFGRLKEKWRLRRHAQQMAKKSTAEEEPFEAKMLSQKDKEDIGRIEADEKKIVPSQPLGQLPPISDEEIEEFRQRLEKLSQKQPAREPEEGPPSSEEKPEREQRKEIKKEEPPEEEKKENPEPAKPASEAPEPEEKPQAQEEEKKHPQKERAEPEKPQPEEVPPEEKPAEETKPEPEQKEEIKEEPPQTEEEASEKKQAKPEETPREDETTLGEPQKREDIKEKPAPQREEEKDQPDGEQKEPDFKFKIIVPREEGQKPKVVTPEEDSDKEKETLPKEENPSGKEKNKEGKPEESEFKFKIIVPEQEEKETSTEEQEKPEPEETSPEQTGREPQKDSEPEKKEEAPQEEKNQPSHEESVEPGPQQPENQEDTEKEREEKPSAQKPENKPAGKEEVEPSQEKLSEAEKPEEPERDPEKEKAKEELSEADKGKKEKTLQKAEHPPDKRLSSQEELLSPEPVKPEPEPPAPEEKPGPEGPQPETAPREEETPSPEEPPVKSEPTEPKEPKPEEEPKPQLEQPKPAKFEPEPQPDEKPPEKQEPKEKTSTDEEPQSQEEIKEELSAQEEKREEPPQEEGPEPEEPQPEAAPPEEKPAEEAKPKPEQKEDTKEEPPQAKEETPEEEQAKPEEIPREEETLKRPATEPDTRTTPPEVSESLKKTLRSRHLKLLDYLKENESISRADYAKLCSISVPTAARDLKKLTKMGLIKAEGPLGPGRVYMLKNSG